MGATYLRIHYSADPAKDKAWAAEERLQSPVKEWLREMEMDENVFDGEAVYPEYVDERHCCLGMKPIPIIHDSIYVGGWDCGQTLHPAFVLFQITPKPFQIHALLEVIPPSPEPMEKFAPRVAAAIAKRLPGHWDTVRHFGDATVATRDGSTGATAQGIARKHGVTIKPSSNEWQGRYSAVTWMLSDSIDEKTPRFLVDGSHCPTLRDGFRGAYRYEESSQSDGTGGGRILARPLKNLYSHVHDALQYGAQEIRKQMFRPRDAGKRVII